MIVVLDEFDVFFVQRQAGGVEVAGHTLTPSASR